MFPVALGLMTSISLCAIFIQRAIIDVVHRDRNGDRAGFISRRPLPTSGTKRYIKLCHRSPDRCWRKNGFCKAVHHFASSPFSCDVNDNKRS